MLRFVPASARSLPRRASPTAGQAALRAVAPEAGAVCHVVTGRESAGSAGVLVTRLGNPPFVSEHVRALVRDAPSCWRRDAGPVRSGPNHLSTQEGGSADRCGSDGLSVPAVQRAGHAPRPGVVVLSLGVLLEDAAMALVGSLLGTVGITLELALGAAAFHGISSIF
jgi:hypothetical protein